MKSDVGVYYSMVEQMALHNEPPSFSYLSRDWPETETWRNLARAKVHELMAFTPRDLPLKPRTERIMKAGGIVTEEVSYQMPYGPRTRGFFIYPETRSGKLPAVLALHDHGGFKYFGKEKVCWHGEEPAILREFKRQCYGGRNWATELAKRGFAVLSVDLFMWGSRKVPAAGLSEDLRSRFHGLREASEGFIAAYNSFASEHEHTIAKTLVAAGSTLQGVFAYEDRRSLDFLMTRSEVDPLRIGCGGLSGGGLRTIFLCGLDSRIKCGVCVGFMSTFRELLRRRVKCHTWMAFLPHLSRVLDLPDLIALGAPTPLMVQCNNKDELFTLEGQRKASQRIGQVYRKMGKPANYSGRFYPGPHKFDVEMQKDAFAWFERWLK